MNHQMEQVVSFSGSRFLGSGQSSGQRRGRQEGNNQHKHGTSSVCDIHWDHNCSFVSQRVKAPSKCGCFLGVLGGPASPCGPSKPSNLKVLASLDFSCSL